MVGIADTSLTRPIFYGLLTTTRRKRKSKENGRVTGLPRDITQTTEEWFRTQDVIPDCQLGARITVAACWARQCKYPHFMKQEIASHDYVIHRAPEFISCVGCRWYIERPFTQGEHEDARIKRFKHIHT